MSNQQLTEKERCELYVKSVIERVKREIREGVPEDGSVDINGGRRRKQPRICELKEDDSNESLKLFKHREPSSTVTRFTENSNDSLSSSSSKGLDLSKKSKLDSVLWPAGSCVWPSSLINSTITAAGTTAALSKPTSEAETDDTSDIHLPVAVSPVSLQLTLGTTPDCSSLQMLAEQCTAQYTSADEAAFDKCENSAFRDTKHGVKTIAQMLANASEDRPLDLQVPQKKMTQIIVAKAADKYYTLSISENGSDGGLVTLIKGGPNGDQEYVAVPTEADSEGNIILPSNVVLQTDATGQPNLVIKTEATSTPLQGNIASAFVPSAPSIKNDPGVVDFSMSTTRENVQMNYVNQMSMGGLPVDVSVLNAFESDQPEKVVKRSTAGNRSRNRRRPSYETTQIRPMNMDKLDQIFVDVLEHEHRIDLQPDSDIEDVIVEEPKLLISEEANQNFDSVQNLELKAMDVRKLERVIEEVIYSTGHGECRASNTNVTDTHESPDYEDLDESTITLPKTVLISNSIAFSQGLTEVVHEIVQPGGFIDKQADDIRASAFRSYVNAKPGASSLDPSSFEEVQFKQKLIRSVVDEVLRQLEEKGLLISGKNQSFFAQE